MRNNTQSHKMNRQTRDFPENLMYDIMVEDLAKTNPQHKLTEKQKDALQCALETLEEIELQLIVKRYKEQKIYRVIGEELNLLPGKCQLICSKALRKLRNPVFARKYYEIT